MFKILITYANGSTSTHAFNSGFEARTFAREGISYSGNRVRTVHLNDHHGHSEKLWDISWNELSKIASLHY